MQGCDKDASGNSDTLRNIIMFIFCAIIAQSVTLSKDNYKPWGFCDMRLVRTCPNRLKCLEPLITAATIVKGLLLLLLRFVFFVLFQHFLSLRNAMVADLRLMEPARQS